jgi:hypothetical protein
MADVDIDAIYSAIGDIYEGMAGAAAWVAVATQTYRIGSRQFVDCYDPDTGQFWRYLPVHSGGGGGADDFVQTPIRRTRPASPFAAIPDGDPRADESTQVVVLERNGQMPTVIGVVPHIKREVRDETAFSFRGEDKDPTPSVHDLAVGKGGTVAILDENGGVTVNVDREALEHVLRLQLPEDGVLRISRDGKAPERLMLSGPLYEVLEELVNRVAMLEDRLRRAVLADRFLYSYVATLVGLPATPPETLFELFFEDPMVLVPEPSLQAAAINISDDTEAGEL